MAKVGDKLYLFKTDTGKITELIDVLTVEIVYLSGLLKVSGDSSTRIHVYSGEIGLVTFDWIDGLTVILTENDLAKATSMTSDYITATIIPELERRVRVNKTWASALDSMINAIG